jgi:hypothetical protein
MGAGGDDNAGLEEELRVGAAELAAVPAESRAVLAKVLGRLEGMRGELEELKADKARSDARIARLEEESKDCEHEEEQEEMEAEKDERTENRNSYYINGTVRHRKQVGVPACGPASWAARTAAVMDACCPATPGGHRRAHRTRRARCRTPARPPRARWCLCNTTTTVRSSCKGTRRSCRCRNSPTSTRAARSWPRVPGRCCSRSRCRCSGCWSTRKAWRRRARCPRAAVRAAAMDVAETAYHLIRFSR